MQLIQIQAFDAERGEAPLARVPQVLRATVRFPTSAWPGQPAFRGDADARAIARPRRERPGDQALVVAALVLVQAVRIGRVEELDAGVERRMEDGGRARVIAIGFRGEPHAPETGTEPH